MNRQSKAYLYALAAVLLWSTSASAFKLTLRRTDYLSLLFYSSSVSMLALLAVIIVQGKLRALKSTFVSGAESSTNPGSRGDDRGEKNGGTPAANLARSAIGGALNPFLYYIVLFKAYSLLPAQEALPLNYTWPVVLTLLALPVLGHKLSARSFSALLISFFGVVVISTRGKLGAPGFADPLGDGLAVGSAFLWATFWLMNLKDKRDPVVKLFLNFIFGFVLIALLLLVLSETGLGRGYGCDESTGASLAWSFLPHIDAAGFLGCVYIGFFEMGFTFVLWLKALSLTRATAKVSNLIFLSPFVSMLFIKLVVGEKILASSILGLALIIGGVLLQRKAGLAPCNGRD